ncbi:hypothetical protein PFISCL1PPCAC_4401, partial [Pristionchus fissidentatus]
VLRPYPCLVCDLRFALETQLEDHIVSVHEQKPKEEYQKVDGVYKCPHCPRKLLKVGGFERHLLFHSIHGERSFQCEKCAKTFTMNCKLKAHMLTHTEERPFGCERCGAKFKSAASLKSHEKRKARCVSLADLPPHQCSICDIRFATEAELKEHYVLHEKEKKKKQEQLRKYKEYEKYLVDGVYKCPDCPRSYPVVSAIERHIRVHTGDRPFECDQCEKKFAERHSLMIHKRLHAGLRPFRCPHCDGSYVSVARLNKHVMKYHSEECNN